MPNRKKSTRTGRINLTAKQKARNLHDSGPLLLRGQDLNLRPLGYEPSELPNCSTPRYKK